MTVRVGVDVGGTFTKAVAFDLDAGEVVAQAVVPTTHDHGGRRRRGRGRVRRRGGRARPAPERIELVTHSTTQAVNALLEGDVGTVGVIGIGRRPDLRKVGQAHPARRGRARAGQAAAHRARDARRHRRPRPGRGGAGPRPAGRGRRRARSASPRRSRPTTTRNEQARRRARRRAGPAGLHVDRAHRPLRPGAARGHRRDQRVDPARSRCSTADVVERGVADAGIVESPVMVMRGDGGATDLAGFRAAPVRTLYSGPAASVAGALRHTGVADGVVVEIGGTSTNVAAIKRGHPALSYVTVGEPRDGAARDRRAGHRRRRRLDAAAARGARSTASARAARTSPGCRTRASRDPATLTDAHRRGDRARGPATRPTTSW